MPKRRDTGRRKTPRKPDQPAGPPPEQAQVERALETIVERLKPKLPKPGSSKARRPDREPGPRVRLSLVWDRDGQSG